MAPAHNDLGALCFIPNLEHESLDAIAALEPFIRNPF